MKKLWNHIDEKRWSREAKYRVALLIAGILFGAAGFILWLLIRPWALATRDWMLCFIGYPVILSWVLVFLYACRHDFHSGSAAD